MTPQDIATLLQEHGGSRDGKDLDEVKDVNDANQKRTELLSDVLATCKDAWSSNSNDIEAIAEKLADGSRDEAWRLPYGDSGILLFFLSLLAESNLSQKLHVHCLRLIGNSCADTEANRARVVDQDRLSLITRHIGNESLLPFNVPVIYNILVDYEPAQLLASQSRLSQHLVALLNLPNLSKYSAFVPFICRVLALLISQDGEPAAADPSTVAVLLRLANSENAKADVDEFISLAGVALAYLASEIFQSRIVHDGQFQLFMDVFYQAHTGFDTEDIKDEETVTQLKELRTSLLPTMADMSAMDSFPSKYSLSSAVAQSFLAWLRGNNASLQSAASLALGNLSRSDEASECLVEAHKAHLPLIQLLSNPAVTDAQQLHAAMSFLKNLAIPQKNKTVLGDLLLPQCLPRVYSLDTLPQIQFAAISLTRLLLLNCPQNVTIMCTPLESSTADGSETQRTSTNDIISLFGRSDAEPTRLEAARCIAAICRTLHSSNVSDILPFATNSSANEDDESLRTGFYSSHDVEAPLKFLITQEKWPSLRSEAWFVFALMSRSLTGADVILSILEDRAAESALSETVTGQKLEGEADRQDTIEQPESAEVQKTNDGVSQVSGGLQLEPQQVDPKQKASMTKVDRENALILCTELVKNCEKKMGGSKTRRMQQLIQEGTQQVITARTELPDM